MLLKHVQILRSGKQIKSFDCAACDLSDHVLNFYGVSGKRGDHRRNISVQYIGSSYVEIDRIKRECIVIPEKPDIQLLITW